MSVDEAELNDSLGRFVVDVGASSQALGAVIGGGRPYAVTWRGGPGDTALPRSCRPSGRDTIVRQVRGCTRARRLPWSAPLAVVRVVVPVADEVDRRSLRGRRRSVDADVGGVQLRLRIPPLRPGLEETSGSPAPPPRGRSARRRCRRCPPTRRRRPRPLALRAHGPDARSVPRRWPPTRSSPSRPPPTVGQAGTSRCRGRRGSQEHDRACPGTAPARSPARGHCRSGRRRTSPVFLELVGGRRVARVTRR